MAYPSNSDDAYNANAEEIRQFIERYEHLEAEKKDIAEQQKEVMAEAKGRGFDAKVMRMVVKRRIQVAVLGKATFAEEEAILELYDI